MNNLYKKYLSDNYIVVNYDLEPLNKDYTITERVLDRVTTSDHHDQGSFEESLIYMRSIVGDYSDDAYIVAKRVLSETEFSILLYK